MEPHAVLIVDAEGRIQNANATARELFGQCVGRACRDVVRVRDILHTGGCQANCAHLLAHTDEDTRAAVGLVAGQPRRVLCAGMAGRLVVTILPSTELPIGAEPLTEREREVLAHVAAGLSSRRIARRLGMSPSTVRTHVEHVREKLGARTRAEAVARASTLGLLDGP